jgi:photosystem II stability/assembly factor-like uncharacterized protein
MTQTATQAVERVPAPPVAQRFIPPPGPYQLNAVYMADAEVGWAVGNGGIILKTANGGRTWFHQSSGTTEDLLGVDSFAGRVAYVVGEGNTLLRTQNGGQRWYDPREYGAGYSWRIRFTDVYLLSRRTAIVVGGRSKSPRASYDIYGYSAIFRRSTDRGRTWTDASAPEGLDQINAVDFMDDRVGIAVGGSLSYSPTRSSSVVARTEDGGITWVEHASPFHAAAWSFIVEDVALFDEVHAAIVATSGVPVALSADEGESWSKTNGSVCGFEEQSISYVDADTLVAVGENQLARSTDGGLRWEIVHSIADQACFCLKSVSAAGMTAVAVGCNSQILRSDDGGATWEEVIL